jgi:hypothetical protein
VANMSPREPACPLIPAVQISGATSLFRIWIVRLVRHSRLHCGLNLLPTMNKYEKILILAHCKAERPDNLVIALF